SSTAPATAGATAPINAGSKRKPTAPTPGPTYCRAPSDHDRDLHSSQRTAKQPTRAVQALDGIAMSTLLANLAGPDLLIILAIVVLLFGSTQLPKLARSLGQASKEFRQGIDHGASEEPDNHKH